MPNRTYQNSAYRFGFNGMEKDDETAGAGNSLNFEARIYDSRLGRWFSLDHHSKPFHSNYEFAYSNPILIIDKDGYDEVIYDTETGDVQVINTNGPLVFRQVVYTAIELNGGGTVWVGSYQTVDWRTSQNFLNLLYGDDKFYNFLLWNANSIDEQKEIFMARWEHDRLETGKGVGKIMGVFIAVGASPLLLTETGAVAGGSVAVRGLVNGAKWVGRKIVARAIRRQVRRGLRQRNREQTNRPSQEQSTSGEQNSSTGTSGNSGSTRGSNKLKPDPEAQGDHSTFKRGDDGKPYKYETYERTRTGHNNPVRRYDGGKPDGSPGAPHTNKKTGESIPTPHMQGKEIPGGVRPAKPNEIPGGGT